MAFARKRPRLTLRNSGKLSHDAALPSADRLESGPRFPVQGTRTSPTPAAAAAGFDQPAFERHDAAAIFRPGDQLAARQPVTSVGSGGAKGRSPLTAIFNGSMP